MGLFVLFSCIEYLPRHHSRLAASKNKNKTINTILYSLLPFLDPNCPRVADVTASLRNMAEDLKEYFHKLFVKKRQPPATHVLILMVSEERGNKKPYALPVQYVP